MKVKTNVNLKNVYISWEIIILPLILNQPTVGRHTLLPGKKNRSYFTTHYVSPHNIKFLKLAAKITGRKIPSLQDEVAQQIAYMYVRVCMLFV